MKTTLRSEKKHHIAPILANTTGKLAETFWFVSSFVISLLLGPFAAVPAILALLSLKIDGPMPLEIS